MHSSILATFLSAFVLHSMAIPVDTSNTHVLQARAQTCADRKLSPCICNGAFGIRLPSATVRNRAQRIKFIFKDETSPNDGTIIQANGNVGVLQAGEPAFNLMLNYVLNSSL